jgi:hypothetical protein
MMKDPTTSGSAPRASSARAKPEVAATAVAVDVVGTEEDAEAGAAGIAVDEGVAVEVEVEVEVEAVTAAEEAAVAARGATINSIRGFTNQGSSFEASTSIRAPATAKLTQSAPFSR